MALLRSVHDSLINFNKLKKREIIAWTLVFVQFVALSNYLAFPSKEVVITLKGRPQESIISADAIDVTSSTTTGSGTSNEDASDNLLNQIKMNNHKNEYYKQKRMEAIMASSSRSSNESDSEHNPNESFYEKPVIHSKDAGLVSRVWHSDVSPSIYSDSLQGSCWCSFDEWCVCTPSLAIDLIMMSGPDHIWVVRSQDTGLLALMGGFAEVGEVLLETVYRELMEEMNVDLSSVTNAIPILFGVYNDPKRDLRRHTTSVVYYVDIPTDVQPKASDDATNVLRISLADVDEHGFFIDHKTIINDFIKMRTRQKGTTTNGGSLSELLPPMPMNGDGEPFRRSVCSMI